MRTARRRLLACLPATLVPAAAQAFRLEEAGAEVTAAYDARACGRTGLHEELLAELDRGLAGQPVPPELAARLAELTRCPFCGCAVAGAPDHGEAREAEPG
jgi:hypothetical protein